MATLDEFIRQLVLRPYDQSLREVFADWLEENGDWRAEFLRLDNALAKHGNAPPPKLVDRWKQLRSKLEAGWIVILDRAPIQNCGYSGEMGFTCPLKWNDLKPTAHGSQRLCDFCNKTVHYCHDEESARQHIRNRDCVAINLGVVGGQSEESSAPIETELLGLIQPTEEG